MRKISLVIFLAIPIIVPAFIAALNYGVINKGEEWIIPVSGYDPRDVLRGQYIQFTYDFPTKFCDQYADICEYYRLQPQRFYMDESLIGNAEKFMLDNPNLIEALIRVQNDAIHLKTLQHDDQNLIDIARKMAND